MHGAWTKGALQHAVAWYSLGMRENEGSGDNDGKGGNCFAFFLSNHARREHLLNEKYISSV
jgi:hypothetical protein